MLVGIGTDLVEMARIKQILQQPAGSRFIDRVLTPEEKELAQTFADKRLTAYVAGRFAAKEAVAKALGCGIGRAVGFHDMRILPNEAEQPFCSLSQASMRRLCWDTPLRIHVSITHSETMAAAFAVIERE